MNGEPGGGAAPLYGVYGLSYSFGAHRVLDQINVEWEAGRVVSLIGPNGSGKSTLLRVMAGILPLSGPGYDGVLRFKHAPLQRMEPIGRARHIAYVGSDLWTEFPLRVRDVVELGRLCWGAGWRMGPEDRAIVDRALTRCLCNGLRDRELSTLSSGERQRVALAQALAQGSKVLLLDESLSRMDLNHQQEMGKLLRQLAHEEGKLVIWVSHDLNLPTEWADDAMLLRRGQRVASGTMKEAFTAANLLKLYPDLSITIAPSAATGAPKVFLG